MVAQIRSWYGRNPAIALALVGLLAVAVVLGVRLMTASAATATLHPDAIATDSADWLSSSGNKVTDVSATDATNFVYLDARNSTEEIIFSVANGSAAWSINGVTMYVVASDLDSRGITANAYVGGSLLDSVSGSPGSTYVTYSKVLATPSGGWTPTNLATLQVGLTPTNKANTTTRLRVDEVYFVVDYSLSTLTVSGANDTGVPTTKVFGGVGDQIAVDRLTLTATDGNATVDQIMVRGLDTADSLTTDVTGVSLWRDDDDGAFDAGDTQVGTTQTFSGAASGSTATFGSLAYSVNVGTPADLWVVYDVGASAVHGHVVGSQLVDGDIDSAATVTFAATPITSGASGQTVEIDASVDTITLTDPLNSAVLTGPTKIIAGTAADLGSGLSAVEVQIIRDGTEYWNGTAWVGTAIWATATVGTPPNWTYSWALDSGQNAGDHTYTVAARATDNFANVKTSPVSTSITVDNTGPTMVSAVALDTSHVDVVFSEDLDGASIAAGDFTIAGISVTAAVLDGTDSTLVHLTTSAQGSGTSYTAQSAAGQVEDLAGNANLLTSANFTGFTPDPALSVSGGNNTGVPTTLVYRDRDARIAVDRLTFTAVDGSVNVTQIVVRGFDTVGALTTDITGVSLWEDDGDETFDDASDTQIGTTQTFSGDTSGSTATFGSLTYSASVGASDIWVVYDIGAAAVDGHIVGSQLIDGDVTVTGPATVTFTATPISSAGSTAGQTVQIDAQNPIADTSDPLSSAVLTGSTKQISGTAADAGSGLSSVDVRIRRDGTDYWNGSAWVGAETWNAATGTTNWAYDWPLDSGQNSGDHAYVITARATDNVARTFTDATPVNAVTVDNTGPAMVSAIALDDTHADVVFSEDLDGASIAAGDFTIAGISVTAAVLDGTDSTLVHLTTSAQGSGTSYTVQAAAGLVDDAYGNGNALTSANFTGFADAGTLSVSQGADAGHPSTQQDIGVSTVAVVDELVWSASGGDVTVGQVVVRGLDTGNALTSNISAVRLFVDNGDGVFVDGPDVQLGSTQTFAVDASGSTVTFGSLGYVVPDGLSRDVWIVYTVSAAAADGDTLGSRVDNGDITAATGSVNGFTDVISADAGQTLAVDAANPAADTTDPLSSATLTGLTKQISGTASDGTGSGIDSVVVSIARSGGTFWNGSAWVGVEVWNVAAGTANWTYDWALDAGQNSDYTYTITARATDNVGLIGTDLTPVTNVTVDNEGPSIASASALDTTTVDVVFDEDLDPATIAPSGVDVSIPGLTVSAAVLQGDSRTLRLTTSAQVPGQSYTAAVAEGNVTDVLSNAGLVSSAGFLGYGATSDTTPPSIPSSVEATSGALPPTVALATWAASSDDVGVSGYKVWRSLTTNGIYVALGTTTGLSFSDDTGIPGEDYYYKVTAFDASGNVSGFSSVAGPIIATWTQAPHATYSVGGNLCRLCHDPHEAAIQSSLMRNTGDEPTESSVCFACHDGQGASTNIKAGADNSFALASGHSLEETSTMPDLTNRCSSCHGPHSNYNGLPFLPKSSVNGVSVTSADNTWCLACHNDTNDWYGAGYPPAATPTRDAIGYPVSGTFPGETTYADPTANAHVSIPASATAETVAGDCLYCHAAHRGANDYDGLNEEYRPTSAATLADDQANGTYAESCFTCHGGTLRSEFTTMPVDIKQFVTAGSLNAGHRIKTAGGTLPVGAPLPCYDCHNPHGSTRGNSSLLADELGQSLDTTSDAGVRSLCFSCHTSSDAKIWESVTTTYTTVGIQTFEGLRRNGGDGSALLLPSNTGHASTDTESCYQCHGDNYTSSGFNVHNPTGGISTGGSGCYACHGVYQPNMEDSAGAKIGAASTTVYHHVLGGAAGDGDIAPHNAPYPTSTSDVYCVSCHSDHNHFNSSPGANLRLDIADTDGSTTADSDFSTSAPYGICVSCHSVSMTKDTTNQLDDGTTAVQPIDGAAFDVSAHQYTVSSEFGAGNTFNADCSKCHNDEQTKDFQTSTYSFGTHYSAARRLLSAFGATVSDPLEENHCYECHAPVGSYPGAKTVSNQDWYGVSGAVMDDPSEYVYESIEDLGGSSHPIKATAGGTVECESCHNPHMVQSSAGNRVTDPDNTLNLAAYTTAAEQAAFCIKCHDGTPPVYTSNPTTYVPYAVTLADVADVMTTYA
ncbi:MAG: hypothetical protein PF636_02540, partial [Actinomycetota bacterium]|nr:hypothetical protein [Actinomycetota bacterium]